MDLSTKGTGRWRDQHILSIPGSSSFQRVASSLPLPIHETSSKERNPTNEALEIASVHHGLENLAGNTNSNLRSIRACTGTPGQGSSPALVPRGLPPHCRTRIYLTMQQREIAWGDDQWKIVLHQIVQGSTTGVADLACSFTQPDRSNLRWCCSS